MDFALEGASVEPVIDVEFFELREFLRRRRFAQEGCSVFDGEEPLTIELNRLNKSQVVAALLCELFERFPDEAGNLRLPDARQTGAGSVDILQPQDAAPGGRQATPEEPAAAGGTPQATAADGDAKPEEQSRHSLDFRSVYWFGEEHIFTPTQAACVKILWENWEQRTPTVGEQTILDTADSAGSRLRDIFKGHPAWGKMIAPAGKGAFRLQEPEKI
jgi:hypothetical protein